MPRISPILPFALLVLWVGAWTACDRGLYWDDYSNMEFQRTHTWSETADRTIMRPAMGYLLKGMYEIAGYRPLPLHWFATFMHAANVVLLLLFLRRLGVGDLSSLFFATMFAFHPSANEASYWIECLPQYVLSATFFLAIAFMLTRRRDGLNGVDVALVSVPLFVNLCQHEVNFTLYVILLPFIWSRWKLSSRPMRIAVPAVALVSTFLAAGSYYTYVSQHSQFAEQTGGATVFTGAMDIVGTLWGRIAGHYAQDSWEMGGEWFVAEFSFAAFGSVFWVLIALGLVALIFRSGVGKEAKRRPAAWPTVLAASASAILMLVPFLTMSEETRYLPARFIYLWLIPGSVAVGGLGRLLLNRLPDKRKETKRLHRFGLGFMALFVFVSACVSLGTSFQFRDSARFQDTMLSTLARFAADGDMKPVADVVVHGFPEKAGRVRTFGDDADAQIAVQWALADAGVATTRDLTVETVPLPRSLGPSSGDSSEREIHVLWLSEAEVLCWERVMHYEHTLRPERGITLPPEDVSEDASEDGAENGGTLSVEWWEFAAEAPADSWRFEGVEIFRLAGRDVLYTFVLKQEGGGTPKDTTIVISDMAHGPEPTFLVDMKIRKNRDEYDFLSGSYRFPVAASSLAGPGPYLLRIELEKDDDEILALEFPMNRSADSAP